MATPKNVEAYREKFAAVIANDVNLELMDEIEAGLVKVLDDIRKSRNSHMEHLYDTTIPVEFREFF